MPLAGIALCIIICMLFKSRMGNRCFGCFPSADSAVPAEMNKEIGKKADTEKTKDRIGG